MKSIMNHLNLALIQVFSKNDDLLQLLTNFSIAPILINNKIVFFSNKNFKETSIIL